MKFELEFFKKVDDAWDFSEIIQSAEILDTQNTEGEIYFKGELIGKWRIVN